MSSAVFTVVCPSCATSFPIDPLKVPETGIHARCTVCDEVFLVEHPVEPEVSEYDNAAPLGAVETPASDVAEEPSAAPLPEFDESDAFEEEGWSDGPVEASTSTPFDGIPDVRPAPVLEDEAEDETSTDAVPASEDTWETRPRSETPELEADEFEIVHDEVGPDAVQVAGATEEELEESSNVFMEDFATTRDVTLDAAEDSSEEAVATVDPVEPEETVAEATPEITSEDASWADAPSADIPSTEVSPIEVPLTGVPFDDTPPTIPADDPFSGEAVSVSEPSTDEFAETVTEEPGSSEVVVEEPVAEAPDAASASPFGRRSPEEKAARLARVLVSDMITYNPDKYQRALETGTLKDDFEDEVELSWKEYVDQVGADLANSSSFFQDALNEIFAKGEQIF